MNSLTLFCISFLCGVASQLTKQSRKIEAKVTPNPTEGMCRCQKQQVKILIRNAGRPPVQPPEYADNV